MRLLADCDHCNYNHRWFHYENFDAARAAATAVATATAAATANSDRYCYCSGSCSCSPSLLLLLRPITSHQIRYAATST